MSRLEDTVEMLLEHADPKGSSYKKLHHIKGMIACNVMVGPNLRAFVAGLVEKMDQIECVALRYDGICTAIRGKGACDHLSEAADGSIIRCKHYNPEKPQLKGDPVQLGGKHGRR